MAVKTQKAVITFCQEADAPIHLRSFTKTLSKQIDVIVIESYQDTCVFSCYSQQLSRNPNLAYIEFDNIKWQVHKVLKLYGSPTFDIELTAKRVA